MLSAGFLTKSRILARRLGLVLPLSIALFLPSACATAYVKNRVRDAGDIFTFELQTKMYGLSVRAGPIKAGLSYKDPDGASIGLSGGSAGAHRTHEFTFLVFGSDSLEVDPPSADSGEKKEDHPLEVRKKNFTARSPFGTKKSLRETNNVLKDKKPKTEFAPAYYYTQVEVNVGIYYGVRVGVNLGELLDFFLGFFTIDVMSDDTAVDG